MPKKLIRQKFDADCAVACIAMFAGLNYEDIARNVTGREMVRDGLGNSRQLYILGLFEIEVDTLDASLIDLARPAIISVASLNSNTGSTHAVYWDGKKLYDPQARRAGRASYKNINQALSAALTILQKSQAKESEQCPAP